MSYKIAAPDEYLAITGMGVQSEIKITKAAWVWPFQKCMRFSVQPHDYAMNLQSMTREKLQFLLPVVLTVGPRVPSTGNDDVHADPEEEQAVRYKRHADALKKFAVLLAENAEAKASSKNFLEQKIRSIVEGEVRVLVSSMTIEEIFTERELFKKRIHKNLQAELDQFGLRIYNANVKELRDAPNSTYFESLSRKAHEGATNQARIDVAEAQLRGNVGESDRKGMEEREIAKINADTAVQKTERDIERSQAEAKLYTKQTLLNRDVDITKVEAKRTLESRDEDLKRDVEIKRAAAETERLRARDVVKATIARESKQQEADAKAYEVEADARAQYTKSQQVTNASAYKTQKDADAKAYDVEAGAKAQLVRIQQSANAEAYKTQKDADANAYSVEATAKAQQVRITQTADADAYRTQKDADAYRYAAEKKADAALIQSLREAEGLSAKAEAYAKMAHAFGGPQGLLQYLMIERGTFVELAQANATAVKGMQPKISVWNTGPSAGGAGGENAGIDTMRNVYQMLPPLMTTINEQTGITLPEWQFGKLAANVQEVAKVNGPKA